TSSASGMPSSVSSGSATCATLPGKLGGIGRLGKAPDVVGPVAGGSGLYRLDAALQELPAKQLLRRVEGGARAPARGDDHRSPRAQDPGDLVEEHRHVELADE